MSGLNIANTGNIAVDLADENLVAVATFQQSATGYALPTSGLYLSTDGGTTWEAMASNEKINNIRWQRPSAAALPSLFVSSRGFGGESWVDSMASGHFAGNSSTQGVLFDTRVNGELIFSEARGGVKRAFAILWGQVGGRIRSAGTQSGYWRYRPTFYGPDFDGDGLSDVLWRHDLTGEVYNWRLDGRSIKSQGNVYTLSDPNWQLVGTGDFDGDGRSDILFRHATTGANYMWMIENNTIHTQGSLPTLTDLNWKVAAVGDVDRDGRADIVWRYEGAGVNQGLVCVWTMNGVTIKATSPLALVSDLNWRIVAIGDFDGDGFSDLFWWHQTTGQTYVWLLGPSTGQIGIKASGSPFTITDLNWRVAGVGDYNRDGKADIVWRNIGTGQNAIWMMNGLSILSSSLIQTVTDQNWKIVGTGDYDGDGVSDLLWRNDSTGQNYLWRMNGFSIMTECAICSPASTTGDIYAVGDTKLEGDQQQIGGDARGMWMMGSEIGSRRWVWIAARGLIAATSPQIHPCDEAVVVSSEENRVAQAAHERETPRPSTPPTSAPEPGTAEAPAVQPGAGAAQPSAPAAAGASPAAPGPVPATRTIRRVPFRAESAACR